MKTLKIFALFLLVVSTSAYSQIEVTGNGKSKLGNIWPNNDYNNEVTHEFFGLNSNSYRPGCKISLGDYGSSVNGGANVFIAEAYGWDSDQMQIQGKNGIFFTVGGVSDVVGAVLYPNGNFYVAGSVFSGGAQLYSDVRLKSNIKNLNGALASILKLQGIAYDYKSSKEDSILTNLSKIETKTDKDAKDLAKFKKSYEDKKTGNLNQIGFSAQDLQKVFPQLVKSDDNGFLTVNYTAIIPVAVEAIKEQQKIIDDQAKVIDALQKDIIAIKRKIGMQ